MGDVVMVLIMIHMVSIQILHTITHTVCILPQSTKMIDGHALIMRARRPLAAPPLWTWREGADRGRSARRTLPQRARQTRVPPWVAVEHNVIIMHSSVRHPTALDETP